MLRSTALPILTSGRRPIRPETSAVVLPTFREAPSIFTRAARATLSIITAISAPVSAMAKPR